MIKVILNWFYRKLSGCPYKIDRGEYGRKGWLKDHAEMLVNTSLSWQELHQARIELGDLPAEWNIEGQDSVEWKGVALGPKTQGITETQRLPVL